MYLKFLTNFTSWRAKKFCGIRLEFCGIPQWFVFCVEIGKEGNENPCCPFCCRIAAAICCVACCWAAATAAAEFAIINGLYVGFGRNGNVAPFGGA